jgi:hypothetical protein
LNAATYGQLAGVQLADHELTVMGVANVARRFDLDEPNNGPAVIFRKVVPYAGFVYGFSKAGSVDNQDVSASTNVADTAISSALTPVTPMAQFYESDVYPLLKNLFQSGTGSRYSVSMSETVRYYAMLLRAYYIIRDVITINNLAYHFDWTKVYPFTDVTPTMLYEAATAMDATEVGIAERWLPLMKRFESHLMFPRMLAETKRLMTPMLSVDLNARLLVPTFKDPFNYDLSGSFNECKLLIDYCDIQLRDTRGLLQSFLPFPIMAMAPWACDTNPAIDIDRMTGWWNSGPREISEFGDTGDPAGNESVFFGTSSNAGRTIWHTRHAAPTWSEVKMGTIWRLNEVPVDDNFWMLTPHRYGAVSLPDDAGDIYYFDGGSVEPASVGWRYTDYAHLRFASTELTFGSLHPGMSGCYIDYEPVLRMLRLEVGSVFHTTILKDVAVMAAGSSLREVRTNILGRVVSDVQRGKT